MMLYLCSIHALSMLYLYNNYEYESGIAKK